MAKYCNFCKQKVQPTKLFSWFWFIVLTIFTGIGGFLYLIVAIATRTSGRCPICNGKDLIFLSPADVNKNLPSNQPQQ